MRTDVRFINRTCFMLEAIYNNIKSMAIFHSHAGIISRSSGKSTVAASAYINACKFYNERQGLIHNFTNKSSVICNGILAPDDTPDWVYDKEKLWNILDRFEDNLAVERFRGNHQDEDKNNKSLRAREEYINSCQTAQTLECALPIELNIEESKRLTKEYLKERFTSRGLVVDYAIHYDEGNPHFHALITRRIVNKDGFSSVKDQEILSKHSIIESRKIYAELTNKYLREAGYDVHVDHRSYKDQGLDIVPFRHQGWKSKELERSGEYTRIGQENDEIRQKNIEIIFDDPIQLIKLVASKKHIFTIDDVDREIIKRV
ncbi:MAG: hypothetical protein EOP34_07960, partial [Rickettsiales bacterium]